MKKKSVSLSTCLQSPVSVVSLSIQLRLLYVFSLLKVSTGYTLMCNENVCMVHHLSTCIEPPVSIGLQRSFYSVGEESGSVEVCAEVTSGPLAGSTIHFDYTTTDGVAVGKHVVHCDLTSVAFLITANIEICLPSRLQPLMIMLTLVVPSL